MKTQQFEGATVPNEGLFCNPHDPIPRGTVLLEKYTVERTLGKGGMGIVVAVRHNVLGELFAIKFLLRGALANDEAVKRFLREARAAARLKSEHVAHVHDVGELPGTGEPYMVMDHLDGQDLKSILRKGPLPIADAVAYLLQVCDALKEAHRKGIVHRDLKPANLFLTTRENGTQCIKVLDFGIAKVAGEDENLTKEGMLGSLKYMSPEQLLKSRTADFRTDIWSLGMIAYEFLTTKTPFDGYGREDIVSHILTEPPAPFQLVRTDIPPALEAVILRCLHKDRNERYQSVVEFELALCEVMGITPPVRATMVSTSINEGIGLPPEMVVLPNDATHASLVVTKAPVSLARGRLKVSMAVVGVVATTATVLTLVAALQEPEQSALANANAGVSAAFGGMAISVPVGSAASAARDEPHAIEMGQHAEAKPSIGTTTSKKALAAMTNKAIEANKADVVEPDVAPPATTTMPEVKPTTTPKPPAPVQTATATATTKSKWGTSPL